MRDIKFRIWDKTRRQYLPDNRQVIWKMADGKLYTLRDQGIWVESDEYVIEQYTGVKDKYGKEIYEGDIVNERGRGVVTWKSPGFYILWDEYSWDILIGSPCEVLGDIHQNPELLEAKP